MHCQPLPPNPSISGNFDWWYFKVSEWYLYIYYGIVKDKIHRDVIRKYAIILICSDCKIDAIWSNVLYCTGVGGGYHIIWDKLSKSKMLLLTHINLKCFLYYKCCMQLKTNEQINKTKHQYWCWRFLTAFAECHKFHHTVLQWEILFFRRITAPRITWSYVC